MMGELFFLKKLYRYLSMNAFKQAYASAVKEDTQCSK